MCVWTLLVLVNVSHDIIQTHSSVPWDWQYYVEYSHNQPNMGIFYKIPSIPQNTAMGLNNVMHRNKLEKPQII